MEGYNKLFKTKEITIVKEVRIYKGPELPFIKKGVLYLGYTKDEKHVFDMEDEVTKALEKLLVYPEDAKWELIDDDKVYFESTVEDDEYECGYLVRISLKALKGRLCCCMCGMRPYKKHYSKAYYSVPLNKDVWDEWRCPECTL